MYNTTTNTTNLDLFAVQHEYCPLIGYDPLKQCCLLGLVLIGVECIAARMYSCKFPDSSGSVANLLKTVKHCLTTTIPIAKYLGIGLLSIAVYDYVHTECAAQPQGCKAYMGRHAHRVRKLTLECCVTRTRVPPHS